MSNLSKSRSAIDRQLGLYEKQAGDWKPEHDRAMDCLDLEAVVGLGLHIYRCIRHADELWSDAVGGNAMPLNPEEAKKLSDWYSWWLRPCDSLIREMARLEAEGYDMNGAAEFRQACLQARAGLSLPPDRVFGDDGGLTRSMTEVRNALRHRLESKS